MSSVTFKQLIIDSNAEAADTLSDIFFQLDALSVTIEDRDAGTKVEKPIFDEPDANANSADFRLWNNSKLTVLLNHDTDVQLLVKKAEELFGYKLVYRLEIVANKDWVRKTQAQFTPIAVTDNLYIVPSWHKPPNPQAISVTLDPGLAFGTGSHPTTFMCLKWLSLNLTSIKNLLDYGCGSGILAITAKKLGVKDVYGTDIDPLAIESSNANMKQNDVAVKFCTPEMIPKIEFDTVIANILSNPLRILAPNLANLSKHKLILSGILEEQALELSNIYAPWFDVVIANKMDGWVLIECSKKV